ncbi:uncharacterized mitochondrial protein AtMg01250-like [Typha angustifolia]|uniref:uncharacterized mitochondrial protein AtMg01250-like n=1 Tax=Typha angustifolia TaxID=59011 RepID=UPI003C2D1AE4
MVRYLKHTHCQSGLFMIKADLSKAFNRMEWRLLGDALKFFGFPDDFIELIQACISTTSLTVEVNSAADRYFSPMRGIRQGCPLSPYLFIISLNVLSVLLEHEMMLRRIRCIKLVRNAPPILQMMFADDVCR